MLHRYSIGIRPGQDSDQQVSWVGCGSPLVVLKKDQVAHCFGELIIISSGDSSDYAMKNWRLDIEVFL